MYKVLYVDEEQSKRYRFQQYAEDEFDVEGIHPEKNLNDMVLYVLQGDFNAVVADHNFREKDKSIKYDGVQFIREVMAHRQSFPCFVLTAYDRDAITDADDVNLVYSKDVLNEDDDPSLPTKATFRDKIKTQIEHYQTKLSKAESEFRSLIEKSRSIPLNATQTDRILELDGFLNKELGKEIDVPMSLKEPSEIKRIQELVAVTERLIEKIERGQKYDSTS